MNSTKVLAGEVKALLPTDVLLRVWQFDFYPTTRFHVCRIRNNKYQKADIDLSDEKRGELGASIARIMAEMLMRKLENEA